MVSRDVPNGPRQVEGRLLEQAGFDLCSFEELRAAGGLVFNFCDSKEFATKYYPLLHRIALYWDGFNVYASDDSCPHAQASLAYSYLEPGRVVCSAHHAVFDLATGECLDKYTRDVTVYTVEVREGRVVVYTPGLVRC
jgi:nitrite reductase/ring-hydroxylating ferredoxin subunit